MPFKVNIATKDGKTWKLEAESEALIGKSLKQKIEGKDVSPDLQGYEFIIQGATDFAGFAHSERIEGTQLRKLLLTKGWGMKNPTKGLRKRKTYRGKELSEKTVQINLILEKEGTKKLSEIFPDQNKAPEPEVKEEAPQAPAETPAPAQEAPAEAAVEEVKEEIAEEVKESIPESPETNTEKSKESAAEEVAKEVVEESKEAIEKAAKDKKE